MSNELKKNCASWGCILAKSALSCRYLDSFFFHLAALLQYHQKKQYSYKKMVTHKFYMNRHPSDDEWTISIEMEQAAAAQNNCEELQKVIEYASDFTFINIGHLGTGCKKKWLRLFALSKTLFLICYSSVRSHRESFIKGIIVAVHFGGKFTSWQTQ